jgi:hypothetical protein
MKVHLADGTYELFRHFYAFPRPVTRRDKRWPLCGACSDPSSACCKAGPHIGVATDRVIESFRNELRPGYKTGEGIEPELLSQFSLLEEAPTALGVTVWPMVESEADVRQFFFDFTFVQVLSAAVRLS